MSLVQIKGIAKGKVKRERVKEEPGQVQLTVKGSSNSTPSQFEVPILG